MAMTPTLFSINGLATELGMDRRTVSKRLADIKPAEVDGRVKKYRLTDVIDLLIDKPSRPVKQSNGHHANLKEIQADFPIGLTGNPLRDLITVGAHEFWPRLFDAATPAISGHLVSDLGLSRKAAVKSMGQIYYMLTYFAEELYRSGALFSEGACFANIDKLCREVGLRFDSEDASEYPQDFEAQFNLPEWLSGKDKKVNRWMSEFDR